jgi:alpha-galactosidase
MNKIILLLAFIPIYLSSASQIILPTPPMGWMSWNLFAEDVTEDGLKKMADAMLSSGMKEAGYTYIFIDDGWQGGRDNQNNILPDAKKFPSGIKSLADYMHSKGLKLGIYSDAAQLTCGGYTASYGFEQQDAKTFADWGIDYLKYDYCGAPEDSATAKERYKAMADALRKCGREIAFALCEWGIRDPWKWGPVIGGQLWRMGGDIRDKWQDIRPNRNPKTDCFGIIDAINNNAPLSSYAGPGKWNDMDMLVVGMYGKEGPSGMCNGKGCTDVEYQTQMSMWCMMAAPLSAGNDLTNMNAITKKILLNKDIISINQDALGIQAKPEIKNDTWYVFSKKLSDGDIAISILNISGTAQKYALNFKDIGLPDKYQLHDVWENKLIKKASNWKGEVASHETKVFRLTKM